MHSVGMLNEFGGTGGGGGGGVDEEATGAGKGCQYDPDTFPADTTWATKTDTPPTCIMVTVFFGYFVEQERSGGGNISIRTPPNVRITQRLSHVNRHEYYY